MEYIDIYLAAAFGFALGYIVCGLLTHSRDDTQHDEHERFPGC